MIKYEDAIEYVRVVQEVYQDFILTGSLGLIMSGKLPVRDVHDIDFVLNNNMKSTLFDYNIYRVWNNSDCICLFLKDWNSEFEYDINLFVRHKEGQVHYKVIDNIKIENPEITIKYKKLHNREKDIIDLNNLIGENN